MNTAKAILSIGKICEIMQAGPAEIREAARVAGVAPEITINGIRHYNESDLGKIRKALTQNQEN